MYWFADSRGVPGAGGLFDHDAIEEITFTIYKINHLHPETSSDMISSSFSGQRTGDILSLENVAIFPQFGSGISRTEAAWPSFLVTSTASTAWLLLQTTNTLCR